MNSKITFFLLVLFFVCFISCQNEISQTTQPTQNEVLTANSTVTTLIKNTVANDGSRDNIIDKASCISIQLPVKVVVNGVEITVNSEADYEIIEANFNEFEEDEDELEIVFPIVILLSDFTEVTINNSDELESFVDDCGGENEMDDDIECIDFVYPVSFSIFDSANQLAETVTVINDEQFYKFMDDLEDYQIVQINFPLKVVLFDGTEQTINDMVMLETAIENAKNKCDEDDDND
ncbi:MAG: hypothetical protein CVU08_11245 [Bacteroidetes bacterium HGW-Bacteroidetes-3]|jgi:hypothetical protein|nr:MAG: hypothetical protein CVU08_11245 [Bacteroidetes bacterium HGW-Bacteroidetes-3]